MREKSLFQTGTALVAALLLTTSCLPAYAADMDPPIYDAPPPDMPVTSGFNWNRCYGGLQIGAQHTMTHEKMDSSPPGTSYFSSKLFGESNFNDSPIRNYITNPDGGTFGGQAGCNFTSGGPYLFGIEADAWYSPSGDEGCKVILEPTANCLENRKRFSGNLTLRGGYLWDDRTLTYFKAGVMMTETAIYNVGNTYGLQVNTATGNYEFQVDQHALWWAASDWVKNFAPTAGVGIEYALGENWTIRGEATVTYVQEYDTDVTVYATRFVKWDATKNIGRGPTEGDKLGVHPREFITNFNIGMNYMF